MEDEIETAFKSGNPEKVLALAENYLGKMNACRDYLKQDLPICRELSKWSEKYFVSCEIINKIFEYIKTKNEELISEISLLAEKYESMPAKLSNDVNIHAELKNLQKFI